MAREPGRRSVSPDSSGADSPGPRQWRNQLGADDTPPTDKHYRKYASGVERALSLFDTALQEWADYISFLNRLLKALQTRPSSVTAIPSKATVAKRLSQCLNPSLPSGVHQKTLEVYSFIFAVIGHDGLSRDLPLYFPGLASVLSFASLTVRAPFLDLLERYFLGLDPRSLRPAMKAVILALLPGLEEETSEDFERTLKLVERFKAVIRPAGSEEITDVHSSGDDFFWQCFFLASITGQTRRTGALAYLLRSLPRLGQTPQSDSSNTGPDAEVARRLSQLVTSPEPGLLIRCFAAGLADDQLLIQRGYLDLLVTHLPLHSEVLQGKAKGNGDLELLLRAAAGVTVRRDMSLNRRLWSWLLGPEPPASGDHDGAPDSPTSTSAHGHGHGFSSRTNYFEQFGLQPLTRALLALVKLDTGGNPAERARPYRICLSLMDRWEIGGLVVPALFLPIVNSVKEFKAKAASRADFAEVLRSASVFFDGVESGLIYGEILALMTQAVGPGELSLVQRREKLELVRFVLGSFNVREEEMVTIHAPLTALAVLCMVEEDSGHSGVDASTRPDAALLEFALGIASNLLELVPERAFSVEATDKPTPSQQPPETSNTNLLHQVRTFYVTDQDTLEASPPPFNPSTLAHHLLQKASDLTCASLTQNPPSQSASVPAKSRILTLLLPKLSSSTSPPLNTTQFLSALHNCLSPPLSGGNTPTIPFTTYTSIISLASHLHASQRITPAQLSELVVPLVQHAWRYLSAAEPKYHVETTRSLWRLQSVLGQGNRDVEAAVCELMLRRHHHYNNIKGRGGGSGRLVDAGRTFAVLWTHTLQDHGPAAAGSSSNKPAKGDDAAAPHGKDTRKGLAGSESYEIMLTRPLFLMLDALVDERTQWFMTAKTWLGHLIGMDKLFAVFVGRFSELGFLRRGQQQHSNGSEGSEKVGSGGKGADGEKEGEGEGQGGDFGEDDDLGLALYYVRTLSNVLRWAPEAAWGVLAKRFLRVGDYEPSLGEITGSDSDISLQEFFLHVCLQCISRDKVPGEDGPEATATQLHRAALTVLHQILLNPFADQLARLHLEHALIAKLQHSLTGPDPYVQVLLLDVVYAALKLRELAAPAEAPPSSPMQEKRIGLPGLGLGYLDGARSSRVSLVGGEKQHHHSNQHQYQHQHHQSGHAQPQAPPPALLKCILAGLNAPSSRPVLDSWVGFLTECLPLFGNTIFQVLIPLVGTLCRQIGDTFYSLQRLFRVGATGNTTGTEESREGAGPETTLISLLNGLEQVLARGHDRLLVEEARVQATRGPDQPQGFFGNMVSGVFASDTATGTAAGAAGAGAGGVGGGAGAGGQTRSATANDRLTVLLAFQDAVRMCFTIWSWGRGDVAASTGSNTAAASSATASGTAGKQDPSSAASWNYTSLRMRNRARRLLEHLFAAETLECLETVIGIWRAALDTDSSANNNTAAEVFNLLPALDGSRPKHTIPALFNALYSRTNPGVLDPSRRSTLTISLADTDLVIFLVDYTRSLEDDSMDEIWQDCMAFLRDILGNPFPHRQTLPSLLEFAGVLGEKVDNTNFGEQRKMRRDLADLFLRLLTAIFTTRPSSFEIASGSNTTTTSEKNEKKAKLPAERADDVVSILAAIVPNLPKILVEHDRVLTAATAISTHVIGPALRAKAFPDTVSHTMLALLQALARLPSPGGSSSNSNSTKSWRKDVSEAFHDPRFFSAPLHLVHPPQGESGWLPLLRQWTVASGTTDKDRSMPDLLARLTPPTTAGIVFGVGATSARLEADRKTQLNLRRIATLVLACPADAFVADLPLITDKITELLSATATSSPSSATRAEVYMLLRALLLRNGAVHLAPLWPAVNAELHAAVASVVAADHSAASDTYGNAAVLQACKLLDLLVCAAPDEFQLHAWLFVSDTVDAVYRPQFGTGYEPVALVDEVNEVLGGQTPGAGSGAGSGLGFPDHHLHLHHQHQTHPHNNNPAYPHHTTSVGGLRRPLLGTPGGISDEVGMERRDELVAKVLRPFFAQLSIYAFESTYAMAPVDWEGCVVGLVRDVFDERSIVRGV